MKPSDHRALDQQVGRAATPAASTATSTSVIAPPKSANALPPDPSASRTSSRTTSGALHPGIGRQEHRRHGAGLDDAERLAVGLGGRRSARHDGRIDGGQEELIEQGAAPPRPARRRPPPSTGGHRATDQDQVLPGCTVPACSMSTGARLTMASPATMPAAIDVELQDRRWPDAWSTRCGVAPTTVMRRTREKVRAGSGPPRWAWRS